MTADDLARLDRVLAILLKIKDSAHEIWKLLDGLSPDTCVTVGMATGILQTAIALVCRDIDTARATLGVK